MVGPSWAIQLPICECDSSQEELSLSSREQQNLSRFNDLKESSKRKQSATRSSKPKPLIQRVPTTLSRNKDFNKYFEPRVVAIGPLHHANRMLNRAEKTKLELAVEFIIQHEVTEKFLYENVKKEIEDLKKCYSSEDIKDYDDEELAWMLFVDGCAVLHAIDCTCKTDQNQKADQNQKRLNIKIDLLAFAQLDLFMLENQLPFRVLEILMSSVKNNGKDLRKSVMRFIDDKIRTTIASGKKESPRQEGDAENMNPPHLLGLLRERLLVTKTSKSKKSMVGQALMSLGPRAATRTFRSISELKESGICVSPSETSSLRDVGFHVRFLATLEIPRIVVDDSTGSKFLNLVAYEMCPDFENDYEVTSYLCFLDSLIDTAQDVKVLRHEGMLLNHMGSDEEVANLFNNITTGLVPDQEMYGYVTKEIQNYCGNSLATSLAKFCYTHFSTPWSIGCFLGALMGLLFTAVQAYFSIQKKRQ